MPGVTRRLPRGILTIGAGYFLAWTLVGLFFFTKEASRRVYWNETFLWKNLLTIWLVGEYLWGVMALVVLWFGMRWPLERPALARRVALHLLLSAGVAGAQLALETAAYLQLGTLSPALSASFWRAWSALLVLGFHGNLIWYWVILGMHTGYRHYRKLQEREGQALRLELHAAELRTQLMRAQMSALKMQLQPHFLFNTLNAIMVLVRQQSAARAEEMLGRLSDLLRCVLDEGEAQEVPLHRELDYVRLYLSIELIRFEDRLRVAIDVDPAVLDAAVPHMALQPLVENALRHGIARTSAAGTIHISAAAEGSSIVIRVKDDGPGFGGDERAEGWGIGLANTRARLAQLYGDAASLTINDGAPGTVVTLVLPHHLAPETPTKDMVHAAHFADR
jgi:two-component system, LytTR family, sensor kinase